MLTGMRVAIPITAAILVLAGCGAVPDHSSNRSAAKRIDPMVSAAGAHLPDLDIPSGLCKPGDGSRYFPNSYRILGQRGDWFFVQIDDISAPPVRTSALPVPSGWHISDASGGTYIRYSATGDIDTPDVRVRVSTDGAEGDDRGGVNVLESFKFTISTQLPTSSVLREEVVDPGHAYILYGLSGANGEHGYLLEVFAKDPDHGYFHTYSVIAGAKMHDFFPIVKAMVAGWIDRRGRPLGPPLPATLP
jgi:hypothetical protein